MCSKCIFLAGSKKRFVRNGLDVRFANKNVGIQKQKKPVKPLLRWLHRLFIFLRFILSFPHSCGGMQPQTLQRPVLIPSVKLKNLGTFEAVSFNISMLTRYASPAGRNCLVVILVQTRYAASCQGDSCSYPLVKAGSMGWGINLKNSRNYFMIMRRNFILSLYGAYNNGRSIHVADLKMLFLWEKRSKPSNPW